MYNYNIWLAEVFAGGLVATDTNGNLHGGDILISSFIQYKLVKLEQNISHWPHQTPSSEQPTKKTTRDVGC